VFAPGGVGPAARAQLTDEPGAPVVLILARLAPNKGIADVVRAVAALPPHLSHTRLAIVGAASDPGFEASLRGLASSMLGTRVRFLGAWSGVEELLRAADVLVLASEAEGLPLSILEAQACGLPTVAYPAGGAAELIEHGVTGMLAHQGDIADLSRQISHVLDDPVLAGRLGEAARKRVLTEDTLQQQADAHAAVLRATILGQGRYL
jgi:glycosyltransferase involved in cell wall biosynthesis